MRLPRRKASSHDMHVSVPVGLPRGGVASPLSEAVGTWLAGWHPRKLARWCWRPSLNILVDPCPAWSQVGEPQQARSEPRRRQTLALPPPLPPLPGLVETFDANLEGWLDRRVTSSTRLMRTRAREKDRTQPPPLQTHALALVERDVGLSSIRTQACRLKQGCTTQARRGVTLRAMSSSASMASGTDPPRHLETCCLGRRRYGRRRPRASRRIGSHR